MPTRTQLVIEGDLVTKTTIEEGKDYNGSYRRETVGETVKLDSLLENLLAARGVEWFVPRLAGGQIIARKAKGQKETIIVELQPAIRRIIEKVDQSDPRARQLACPWVYFKVNFKGGAVASMKVFYRNSPVAELTDDLNLPNLPNVYGQDKGYVVCTGSMSGCEIQWGLPKKIEWLSQKFWDSTFNTDLVEYHWKPSRNLPNHPRSFAEWETRTSQDPKFILGIAWRSANLTVGSELESWCKNG